VDLVISGLMMPRLTGFELREQMKRNKDLKNIPVIPVTSLESREEQEKRLSRWPTGFLPT
jgi:two-component system chemotaxis sensor kinase CheA